MKDWESLEPDVTKLLTKHYTPHAAGRKVDKVVVHYNAGNLTVEGCWSVWQTREASAHYQVESSGRVGQLVYDKDIAWHAGVWSVNESSIGIEHANLADGTITEACLDAGSHLVAALCKHYNLGRPQWLVNVFPHKHFKATSCPGQIYGSQKDAYIQRAQYWYDVMTGAVQPEKPVSERLPEVLRGFTDLDPDAWYIGPIEECVREGYMGGYKGGKEFGPSDALTRGQAVCVMANFERVDLTDHLEPFEDVDAEPYYYTALCWALDNGYVSTASGKFRPGDAVTRSDLLTFLWRMEGEPEPKGEPAGFPDWKDVPEWAEKPVAWAVENGIVSGSKGKLSPISACTRAEACAMLANLAKVEA